MLQLVITIVLVGLLTWLYARLARNVDRFEKEPTRYLLAACVWGAVPAIVLSVVLQLALDVPAALLLGEGSLGSALLGGAIVAPATEEVAKGLAVAFLYLARRREFDGWVDGLVYGAMAGFGFGFVENVLYLLGAESWGEWIALFILRVVVFGFMHGVWTALTGIGFGAARHMRQPSRKILAILAGLSAAALSHLLHNGALILIEGTGGGSLVVTLFNYAALLTGLVLLNQAAARNDRQVLRTYLRDEVPDRISADDYAALSEDGAAQRARLKQLRRQRPAFIQAAAELAQKKRQLIRLGDEGGTAAEIQRWRDRLGVEG